MIDGIQEHPRWQRAWLIISGLCMNGWKLIPDEKITVPAGFTLNRLESQIPRKQIGEFFRVTHWNVMPSGGHFPALEEPELLVKDICTVFRDLR